MIYGKWFSIFHFSFVIYHLSFIQLLDPLQKRILIDEPGLAISSWGSFECAGFAEGDEGAARRGRDEDTMPANKAFDFGEAELWPRLDIQYLFRDIHNVSCKFLIEF